MDQAQEHDIYIGSEANSGGRTSKLPKISDYPADEDAWRELPSSLSARVLELPPLIRATQRSIDFTWNEIDPEDGMEQCRDEAVKLGCKAADLAIDLRRRMKLPKMQSRWDWVSDIKGMESEIEDRRKREQGSQVALMTTEPDEIAKAADPI